MSCFHYKAVESLSETDKEHLLNDIIDIVVYSHSNDELARSILTLLLEKDLIKL